MEWFREKVARRRTFTLDVRGPDPCKGIRAFCLAFWFWIVERRLTLGPGPRIRSEAGSAGETAPRSRRQFVSLRVCLNTTAGRCPISEGRPGCAPPRRSRFAASCSESAGQFVALAFEHNLNGMAGAKGKRGSMNDAEDAATTRIKGRSVQ